MSNKCPAPKFFFCYRDKYRKSHCNTLETWITQSLVMPCVVHLRKKLQRYFGSTAARFIAGASNPESPDEFTDVPMPSFSADWKMRVFCRRRLRARSAFLVGQYGAGARGSEYLTTPPVVSGKGPREMCRRSTKKCRSESVFLSTDCRRWTTSGSPP